MLLLKTIRIELSLATFTAESERMFLMLSEDIAIGVSALISQDASSKFGRQEKTKIEHSQMASNNFKYFIVRIVKLNVLIISDS